MTQLLLNLSYLVISTEASWLYREAQWRDLQVARVGDGVSRSGLQVLT
ncbi:MAG TPA: hypothetical protein VGG18_12770 [Granulicella sp.]